MTDIPSYYDEEVYVLCGVEDQETNGVLRIFDRLSQLQAHMTRLNVGEANNLRVIHGVFSPARYLPSRLRGMSAYMVVMNKNDAYKGLVFEATSSSTEELAADLASVISDPKVSCLAGGEKVDDFHILWGYEISICLSVDEDDIDEEAMDSCLALSAEVNEIKKRVLENAKGE